VEQLDGGLEEEEAGYHMIEQTITVLVYTQMTYLNPENIQKLLDKARHLDRSPIINKCVTLTASRHFVEDTLGSRPPASITMIRPL